MLWPQLRALGRAAPRAALHFPHGLPSLTADSVVETLGVFWRPSRMGIDRFPHLVSACFKLSNFMLRYKEAEREQDRCDEEPFRAEDGSERSFDDVRAMLKRNYVADPVATGLPRAAPRRRNGRWTLPSGQARWHRAAMMDSSALRDTLADRVVTWGRVRPGGQPGTVAGA